MRKTNKFTCIVCGKKYIYDRGKGHTTQKCNSCMSNSGRKWKKEKLIEYAGGKCEICGYNKCNEALEFHHKNPNEKDFYISGNHGRRFEVLFKEVDKCILVCSNCHREIHSGLHPAIAERSPRRSYKPKVSSSNLDRRTKKKIEFYLKPKE